MINKYREHTVKVDLKDRSYDIQIGEGNISRLPVYLENLVTNRQVAIIAPPPVADLYLDSVSACFGNNWNVQKLIIADGETSKTQDAVSAVYTWLLENHFERGATIIPLGGGVTGDMAGFVAATYLRGINLVHVPTSLLAQVDSSIGGKVGINHPLGKNLIGAFYQPRLVLTDINFLKTLNDDEYYCGLGEVIKYGILSPAGIFEKLENNLNEIKNKNISVLSDIVHDCIQIKAEIVKNDEKEAGIRAFLNLGHTYAHAFETDFKYAGLKHGQAVILGIRCAVAVSRKLKLIPDSDAIRIESLLDEFNIHLPRSKKSDRVELLAIMKRDKKTRAGSINLVLPRKIGEVTVMPVTDESLILESFAAVGL